MPSILKSTKTFNNMKKEGRPPKCLTEIIKADVIEAIKPDTPDSLNYTKTYSKNTILLVLSDIKKVI